MQPIYINQNGAMSEEEGSLVLEEQIDPNYVPTQEEILEYAEFLGMDPVKDKKYLFLAEEGLKAPLPQEWKPCQNKKGDIYYFNFKTGEQLTDHPCDLFYKKRLNELKQRDLQKAAEKQMALNKQQIKEDFLDDSFSELEDDSLADSQSSKVNLAGRIRPKKSNVLKGIFNEKAQKQKWDQ